MPFDTLANELGALTTLSPQQALALGVFVSYFGLIGWLFSKVLASIQGLASRALQTVSKAKGPSRKAKDGSRRGGVSVQVFAALTLASFAHTWFYMFKYMAGSFQAYELSLSVNASSPFAVRLTSWLRDTSLFEEAWYAVCEGRLNWLWSEQLCLFTAGVWTVMLWVEGTRHGIQHVWAYMVLGQVVAISVASNLFYLAVLSAPRAAPSSSAPTSSSSTTSPRKPSRTTPASQTQQSKSEEDIRVPPAVYVPVLLSLATVAASPHTSPKTFLPNLLIMHALLVVPLLPRFTLAFPSPGSPQSSWSISLSTLYYTIFLLSIPIRYRTLFAASDVHPPRPLWAPELYGGVLGWFERQWVVLFESPAQSSIGWDVVWTSVSFVVWVLVTGGSVRTADERKGADGKQGKEEEKEGVWTRVWKVGYLVFVTPLASVGVTGAYVLMPRGRVEESDNGEGVKEE
ncbi:hypothetical protein FA13DRAFT_1801065 [Coprinellus micaceus]|uniref:Uncharacterized protein n=1 Tax=Coprinellus micaceus TaxID=71717 RepID=A0A4Y7SF39_COPMI|nr:hypothetical protein FA13DRAFT_1801065 [Coprinellus micaceus]